jgi:hypothetical protein
MQSFLSFEMIGHVHEKWNESKYHSLAPRPKCRRQSMGRMNVMMGSFIRCREWIEELQRIFVGGSYNIFPRIEISRNGAALFTLVFVRSIHK